MDKEIKIGDKLYYHGLGYGSETFVYDIYKDDNGLMIVHANNGARGNYSDVVSNVGNLCISKEVVNKRLVNTGNRVNLIE